MKRMKKKATIFALSMILMSALFISSQKTHADSNIDHTDGTRAAVTAGLADIEVSVVHNLLRLSWSDHLPTTEPVWRSNVNSQDARERLLRYDRSSPDQIFREGFAPTSQQQNIYNFNWHLTSYVSGHYTDQSNPFVSTTRPEITTNGEIKQWVPESGQTNYVYEIFAPGGIDVNASLGKASPYPNQSEIIFPGGIRREFIRSVRVYKGETLTSIIVNPYFQGVSHLPNMIIPKNIEVMNWNENDTSEKKIKASSDKEPMKDLPGRLVLDPYKDDPKNLKRIPDGVYKIASSIDRNVVVKLPGNQSGTRVQAYQYQGEDAQKWQFTYHSGAIQGYSISNVENPNLVLTWYQSGSDVTGHRQLSQATQYWNLEETADGYFKLRNKKNSAMVLDLTGGETNNGNKIQVNTNNTDPQQKWQLQPIAYQTIKDGVYTLRSGIKQEVAAWLSGEAVQVYRYTGLDSHKWQFVYDTDVKAYRINNVENPNLGMAWSISDNNVVGSNQNTNREFWRIEQNEDGYFKLRNLQNPKMVLDLANGGTNNNTPVQVVEDHTNLQDITSQKWKIKPVSYQPIDDGEYILQSNIDQKVVATLTKSQEGAAVQAYQYVGVANQQWQFIYDKTQKAYRICSVANPSLRLTYSLSDRLAVGSSQGITSGFWLIEQTEDGYFKLRSLLAPQNVLELVNGETSNGNKIQIINETFVSQFIPRQKWKITPLP